MNASTPRMGRREALAVVLSAVAALALFACDSGDDSGGIDDGAAATPPPFQVGTATFDANLPREPVLPQDTQLRGTSDRSTLRRQFAGQQLHEGGLPRAVGSRETVTPVRRKARGHIVEEHLRAEPHGHAAD